MSKKDNRITVRLDATLQAQVNKACAITGLDEPTIIRECLKAFTEEVQRTGEIRLPLAIVPKSKAVAAAPIAAIVPSVPHSTGSTPASAASPANPPSAPAPFSLNEPSPIPPRATPPPTRTPARAALRRMAELEKKKPTA